MNITINNEKNGIELRFDSKPAVEIITAMKNCGFRYSVKQKMWYAKNTDERLAMANSIADGGEVSMSEEVNQKNNISYDLWEMTRTDDIENNFEKEKLYNNKEIAARIRKHLRQRFAICKWSVRIDGYNSIYVHITSSPFDVDSDALKAIAHYAYVYAESWNYNNSDSMSDYYDVNFYGVYESSIIDRYEYKQREATAIEYDIEKDFNEKKAAFEVAEEERKEKEYQERLAQRKIEEAEYQKREEQRKANHKAIEDGIKVEETEYFVIGCREPDTRKEDSISGYFENDVEYRRCNCKVTRDVYMTEKEYSNFANMLLDDYSFLEGMGGTETDDLRINSMEDYRRMSKAERKTVEWYNTHCVAIYCNNELKLVINPEGYSYASYVYFVDSESKIEAKYTGSFGIDKEVAEKNSSLAAELEDVSAEIIINNGMIGTWDTTDFCDYKKHMKNWIYEHEFPFSVGVVRAIKESKFKDAMYRLLTEVNGMQEQFNRANLETGQKITIVRISDFGGINTTKAYFEYYEDGKYAQYNDAVKLVYKPAGKRGLCYSWLYNDVLIFDGWVDIPENLLWEISNGRTDGVTVKKSIFDSFDKGQYDVVLEYFKNIGITPVINTYKPQF